MLTAAQLVVHCLETQGVKYVFGIPGAKIDAVFNALEDSSIELILCRHEQNAVFMAAMYGRLTETPGVVLVTSGPGITNMTTGLLTATTESDPVVALGGAVPCTMRLKSTHQNADNVAILSPVTNYSVEVVDANNIPEAIATAFQYATNQRRGASFISLPQDILTQTPTARPLRPVAHANDVATEESIQAALTRIHQAKRPLLLLGEAAARSNNARAIHEFLNNTPLPVACTYEAAGVVSQALEKYFVGRLGLFQNQPGDMVLSHADLVIAVGFNPVEYDPELWNKNADKTIIHIHYLPEEIRKNYQPDVALQGDIGKNIESLTRSLEKNSIDYDHASLNDAHKKLYDEIETGKTFHGNKIHPLRFIYELKQATDDETTLLCDIGSVYMWMARYFLVYQPHHLLFSNGQQTLGVGLPWAMAATLARPGKRIVSISGDGGFLFSATELETAVRNNMNFVHFVWTDGSYNMVLEQEVMKYKRRSGVDLGKVDIPLFAKAFGATGFSVNHTDELANTIQAAFAIKEGPVLVNIPIDYSHNASLFTSVSPHQGN